MKSDDALLMSAAKMKHPRALSARLFPLQIASGPQCAAMTRVETIIVIRENPPIKVKWSATIS